MRSEKRGTVDATRHVEAPVVTQEVAKPAVKAPPKKGDGFDGKVDEQGPKTTDAPKETAPIVAKELDKPELDTSLAAFATAVADHAKKPGPDAEKALRAAHVKIQRQLQAAALFAAKDPAKQKDLQDKASGAWHK